MYEKVGDSFCDSTEPIEDNNTLLNATTFAENLPTAAEAETPPNHKISSILRDVTNINETKGVTSFLFTHLELEGSHRQEQRPMDKKEEILLGMKIRLQRSLQQKQISIALERSNNNGDVKAMKVRDENSFQNRELNNNIRVENHGVEIQYKSDQERAAEMKKQEDEDYRKTKISVIDLANGKALLSEKVNCHGNTSALVTPEKEDATWSANLFETDYNPEDIMMRNDAEKSPKPQMDRNKAATLVYDPPLRALADSFLNDSVEEEADHEEDETSKSQERNEKQANPQTDKVEAMMILNETLLPALEDSTLNDSGEAEAAKEEGCHHPELINILQVKSHGVKNRYMSEQEQAAVDIVKVQQLSKDEFVARDKAAAAEMKKQEDEVYRDTIITVMDFANGKILASDKVNCNGSISAHFTPAKENGKETTPPKPRMHFILRLRNLANMLRNGFKSNKGTDHNTLPKPEKKVRFEILPVEKAKRSYQLITSRNVERNASNLDDSFEAQYSQNSESQYDEIHDDEKKIRGCSLDDIGDLVEDVTSALSSVCNLGNLGRKIKFQVSFEIVGDEK